MGSLPGLSFQELLSILKALLFQIGLWPFKPRCYLEGSANNGFLRESSDVADLDGNSESFRVQLQWEPVVTQPPYSIKVSPELFGSLADTAFSFDCLSSLNLCYLST